MTHKKHRELVRLRREDVEEMLCRATEAGAKRALADVGLHGEDAATDIKELRSLLSAFQFARRTALRTTVKIITTAILVTLMAGLAIKLKLLTILGGK